MIVKLIARFVHERTGSPLADGRVTARVFDRDPLSDDFLAESQLSETGEAEWMFPLSAAASMDSPAEKRPDIYVELEKDGDVFFQGMVAENIDFFQRDPVSGELRGRTHFLGTFRVKETPGDRE